MLRLEGIEAGYSAVPVLHGLSLAVDAGQFVSIVGPNGAGKTTLFKTISGTLRPTAGNIRFEDVDLLGRAGEAAASWHRARPGGPPGLPLAHGSGEP
jgi:ABC-type branched-subunit amino acid transport system ATPase component